MLFRALLSIACSNQRPADLLSRPLSSAVNHIVVVVRLRVIVILYHWEAAHVAGSGALGPTIHHSALLLTCRAAIWQVPMDGQVGVVLELKLLLVGVRAIASVRLARRQLLRLQPLLVASARGWLSTLALSNSIFLRVFKFVAIHVL